MCPPKMVHFFSTVFHSNGLSEPLPNIPKESFIREALLINRSSGGIQMGHNFDSVSKKVAFCIGNMFPRQAFKELRGAHLYSYPFQWIIEAPGIPKESFIREAPLINRLSGGIQMGHNFDSINKKVTFLLAICFQDRHLKNSEELIYIKISGISMGLMWTCVLEVGIPMGLFTSQVLGICMGPNFWLGRHTPKLWGGR